MAEENWTIGKIQTWGTNYLNSKSIEDSKKCIDLLLCNVLNLERIDLYIKNELPLNVFELNEIKEKIKRLVKNEPLQYVLGDVSFYGLKFYVNSNVLIPRPETEELVDLIVKENSNKSFINILDIGCGSGCIGISLAKSFPQAKCYAIDISPGAIETAKLNANANEINNIEFYVLDILKKIPKTKFDIIVSNPPYISTNEFNDLDKNVKDFEPRAALTDEADGLSFYRRFNEIFERMLTENGIFYFENSYEQGEKVSKIFSEKYEVETIKDINKIERFVKGVLRN